MAALSAGMEQGPDAAIEVCKIQAPAIALSVSSESVKIGRTTHKLRNPENAPKAWMQPLLESYLANPEQQEPMVVQIDKDTFGYVEPIFVKGKCLNCHGSELKPAVTAQLKKMYPGDQATGFAEGDFRGLFWVQMKQDPSPRI